MIFPTASESEPILSLAENPQLQALTPHHLLQFETHIVEHCDLNCQMCTHFSPLANPEFTDINAFARDMYRLGEIFGGQASYIMLLGGEPLLHPQLPQFFDVARLAFPYADITLYSNGLRLHTMGESFWTSCQRNSIRFILTRYPISADYDGMVKMISAHALRYEYCNTPSRPKRSSHFPLDLNGGQDPKQSFSACSMANRCISLRDGKLYPCCVVPNIRHFNRFFQQELLETSEDGVDIFEINDANEIMCRLASPIPFCRYCDVNHRTFNHIWHTSNRVVSEWTLK